MKLKRVSLSLILIVSLALVITFGFLPLQTSAFSVDAASGYWQDIQNAVNQVTSQGGGEVHIPAGTWDFVHTGESWTGNGGQPRVSVPAGVSIFGATNNRDANGYNTEWNTVLRLPSSVAGSWEYDGISWFKITGTGSNSPFTRFSDLKLVGYRSIDSNDPYELTGLYINNLNEFRVDHCYFEHTCLGGVKVYGLNAHGVIDHCRFINPVGTVGSTMNDCSVFYGVSLGRGMGDLWDSNIQNVLGKYTSYTVFIEDCYFSHWRHCIAANSGAHYVLRYSMIENDFGYGSIDAHGWGAVDSNGVITQVGTRAVEIYQNHIVNAIQNPWVTFIRGGAGVSFNNVAGGGTYTSFMYFSNEANVAVSKCWCKDWYIWNNQLNSVTLKVGEPLVNEGEEYFLYQPTWYTPFVYPHPLVSGEVYVPPEPTPTPTSSATPTPTSNPNASPTSEPGNPVSPSPSPDTTLEEKPWYQPIIDFLRWLFGWT